MVGFVGFAPTGCPSLVEVNMMEDLRDTLGVLLEADVGAVDRDAVAGLLRKLKADGSA